MDVEEEEEKVEEDYPDLILEGLSDKPTRNGKGKKGSRKHSALSQEGDKDASAVSDDKSEVLESFVSEQAAELPEQSAPGIARA